MTPTPYTPLIPPHPTYDPLMDFPTPELSSTPPKLSLFSLPPSKQPDVGVTPPLNTVAAAVPFLWEEAPGKPRSIATDDPPKSKAVRSLDLPPRLTAFSPANNGNIRRDKLGNNVGVEIIPSPTTVLGGPYEGVYTSSNSTLDSSEKMVIGSNGITKSKSNNRGKSSMPLRKLMRKDRSSVKFRSWRWERDGFGDIDEDRSPPATFCSWRWDSFRDNGGGGGDGASFNSGYKIGKISRKNSFIFDNGSTSRFLANMYGTLKQAIPWRSRRS